MSFNYYPILKWKKGEQEALKNLKRNPANLYPVIEIIDECLPSDFFTTLSTCYSSMVYFDVSRLDPEYFNDFIIYATEKNIPAFPAFSVENFVNNVPASLPNTFAVKIPIPVDFEGPSFEEIINILSSYQNRDIILFLDAGEVLDSRTANYIYDSYCRTIYNNMNALSFFTNVIICLTSFPEQLNIESGEDMAYKRYDFLIYKKLIAEFKSTILNEKIQYSDYGVTKFTETELDFSKMRYGILPKVKYTTETQYIVKKGEKDRINNIFTRSYIDIAKEIVNSPYYFGKEFSYGDKCIYEKANTLNGKPGGAPQWVTYCANHHIAVLMEQLSNLHGF